MSSTNDTYFDESFDDSFDKGSPDLLSIYLLPPDNQAILAGETLQFKAMGIFSDGLDRDITSSCVFASSDAAVSRIDSRGLALGVGMGQTTITAALGGLMNNDAYNLSVVIPGIVKSINWGIDFAITI